MEDALELFWILLSFEVQLLPIGNPTPGGQSLLLWKMLSKYLLGYTQQAQGVSILVVVEDALEDVEKSENWEAFLFQSLF